MSKKSLNAAGLGVNGPVTGVFMLRAAGPEPSSGKSDEAGIVCPYFCHTSLDGREADLQIEDARPPNIELIRYVQAPRHEGGGRRKDGRPAGIDQRFNEP